jgi:hypothetical protein
MSKVTIDEDVPHHEIGLQNVFWGEKSLKMILRE